MDVLTFSLSIIIFASTFQLSEAILHVVGFVILVLHEQLNPASRYDAKVHLAVLLPLTYVLLDQKSNKSSKLDGKTKEKMVKVFTEHPNKKLLDRRNWCEVSYRPALQERNRWSSVGKGEMSYLDRSLWDLACDVNGCTVCRPVRLLDFQHCNQSRVSISLSQCIG